MDVGYSAIGLLGAGGHAAEVSDYARQAGLQVAFSAVESAFRDRDQVGQIELTAATGEQRSTAVIAAVGAPAIRARLVRAWPGEAYARIVSDQAYVSRDASVGAGTVVAPFGAVGARSQLGKHVVVNLAATISHDCVLGDYATVSPGAHIGGGCRLGAGVFVGIGAVVRDHVVLAPGSVIGAGAVVIGDTVENGTYIGVPARCTEVREDWLDVV